jgi:hypothetical protein
MARASHSTCDMKDAAPSLERLLAEDHRRLDRTFEAVARGLGEA